MLKKLIAILSAALCLASCDFISSFIHDDDVVAKAGKAKLYASQLQEFIPKGISPEDSTNLAMQYINTWAQDILFTELASTQLSKQEKDVSKELEDYRRSLLKYRYEQHYISDRLDTLVTDEQMESYYKSHESLFTLEHPVVKVRYVDILKDSQNKDAILSLINSDKVEDIERMDSLAFASALKYFDSSDRWIDISVLADEFEMDYNTLLSKVQNSMLKLESKERGDVRAAYICAIQKTGTAPIEYCSKRIRDILISARKRALVSTLEQDLLKEALEHNQLIIYTK